MPGDVVFHFDFISPYAYLAWTQIHRVVEAHGRRVVPVPVLFAGLLSHHGTKGPAEVPAKRRYLMFDTTRKARLLGVPYGPPKHHPFNPLLALRVASVPMDDADRRRVIDRIYAGIWAGRREDPEDRDGIGAMLGEIGIDANRTLDAALSDEGKNRLKSQTAGAIEHGVFGVPTMIVDDEPFWGVDSLPDLERYLTAPKPTLDAEMLRRMSAVVPSAVRKGA